MTGHTDKGGATVAYDTRTGKQLWARQSTLTAYAATELAVSPDSTTVYVAGVGRKLPFAVIAYAAATGKRGGCALTPKVASSTTSHCQRPGCRPAWAQ